jgi:hypothetical protein
VSCGSNISGVNVYMGWLPSCTPLLGGLRTGGVITA